MTIDRVIRVLKDAISEAEDCIVELDAKVQDLEIQNQGLSGDIDGFQDEVSTLQAENIRLADRLSEALAEATRAPGLKPEER